MHDWVMPRLLDAVFPARKTLRDLRARWGRPADADSWYASRYFDLVPCAVDADAVDDKTWSDLEFPALFAQMDSTVSPVGSQVLFRRMRNCGRDPAALAEQYRVYALLADDAALREKLQRRLLPLQHEYHARIADFLFGPLAPALRYPRLLHAWALASLGVLVAAFAWPWLIWLWVAMLLANLVVLARVGLSGRTLRDVQTLRACMTLVKAAGDLARVHAPGSGVPQLAALRAEGPPRARLSRALGWLLAWTTWSKVFPTSIVVAALNVAFLAELIVYVHAMRRFAELRHTLAPSFEQVGAIDAAIAVASWLQYCGHHCSPTLTDDAVLEIRDGRHPLLPDGVANSLRLDHRSTLVTGSNMAGKTTFIKMLGVNALLGQTLGFCVAAAATIPHARVLASIQAAHSVASGKSHYFWVSGFDCGLT